MATTARGGVHRGGQKYQNTFAFKHNKNSKKTAKILGIQHGGLCERCDEKIEWRKKFRKYKPLKAPRKCRQCERTNISRAYHAICTECASAQGICAICTKERPRASEEEDEELRTAKRASARDINLYFATLRERERRRTMRLYEEGRVVFYVQEGGALLMKRVESSEDGESDGQDGEDSGDDDEGAGQDGEDSGDEGAGAGQDGEDSSDEGAGQDGEDSGDEGAGQDGEDSGANEAFETGDDNECADKIAGENAVGNAEGAETSEAQGAVAASADEAGAAAGALVREVDALEQPADAKSPLAGAGEGSPV